MGLLNWLSAYRRRSVPRILDTTMLGSPAGFSGGSGSRLGAGGSSLSNGLPTPDARRQREAVSCDRVAQQRGNVGLVGVGQVGHTRNMKRKGFEGESGP